MFEKGHSFYTKTYSNNQKTDNNSISREISHPKNEINILSSAEIYYTNEAYEGYNLFILERKSREETRKVYNRTLLIVDMRGHIIYQKEIGSTDPEVSLDYLDTEWINTTTIMYGTEKGVVLWNYYTKKQILYPNIRGHHEYEYNPINQTIFTF